MGRPLNSDEILALQRIEATKIYADKVNALQKQAVELENTIKNLQSTIDVAVMSREQELEHLIMKAQTAVYDAEVRENKAKMLLTEALTRSEEAKNVHESVLVSKKSHEEERDVHINNIQIEKEEIAKRLAFVIERESSLKDLIKIADENMAAVIAGEVELKFEEGRIKSLSEQIKLSLTAQKSVENVNRLRAKELEEKEEILVNLQNSNKLEQSGFIEIRDQLDKTRADLIAAKVKIDEKVSSLKALEVKVALDSQRLQEREKDVQSQMAKLNELKNNVDSLLKLQEKGV